MNFSLFVPISFNGSLGGFFGKAQILISPVEVKNDLGNSYPLTVATVFQSRKEINELHYRTHFIDRIQLLFQFSPLSCPGEERGMP